MPELWPPHHGEHEFKEIVTRQLGEHGEKLRALSGGTPASPSP